MLFLMFAAKHDRAHITIILCFILLLYFLFFLFLDFPVWSQIDESKELEELFYIQNADIRIDGQLDESAWKAIPPIKKWFQLTPNEGEKPSERTEMWLFYDETAIYLGARLYTKDTSTLVTRSLERDSYSPDQDAIAIIMDTLNDNRTAFGFIVSSEGIRTDIAIYDDAETGSTPWNTDWNAFWDASTHREPDRWSAEIRIPFSSLRYKTKDSYIEMGLILWRYIAKNVEYDTFPAIPNKWGLSAYKPSQALDVKFKNVRTKHPVYIRPYVLAGVEQENILNSYLSSYELESRHRGNIGLDLKYNLTSNHVLDGTLNPDFAQVEADDQRINLTRFSLFFPEKRPFFQERSDLFDFRIPVGGQKLFHSRTIGIMEGQSVPIIGGIRITGRTGNWQFGFLEIQTAVSEIDGQSIASENFGVFRVKREVKNDGSYIGGMLTSRTDFSGNYNLVTALDSDISISAPHAYLKIRLAQSSEPGTPFRKSLMGAVTLESRIRRGFSYAFVARHIGSEFHPGLGYLYRENVNLLYSRVEYIWIPDTGSAIQNHGFQNKMIGIWNSQTGEFETFDNNLYWEALLRSGTYMKANLKLMEENLKNPFSVGEVEIAPGRYRFASVDVDFQSPSGLLFQFGIKGIGGGYYGGWQLGSEIFSSWTLSPHLTFKIEYMYNFVKIAEQTYEPHVVRFRIRSALNKSLSANAFIQYSSDLNQLSSNFRFRFNPTEGVDLYIVFNEGIHTSLNHEFPPLPRSQGRSILIKFNYTFIL
jgi:hypothetical protein